MNKRKGIRRVIMSADDFGQSREINLSIMLAHRRGITTSTSLMANMSAALHAAKLASSCQKLEVGLHVNLTYGAPVSNPKTVPSLVDKDGHFVRNLAPRKRVTEYEIRRQVRNIVADFERRANAEEVKRELYAQINLFRKIVGHWPEHVDGHHHIHETSLVLKPLIKFAQMRDVVIRQTGRSVRIALSRANIRTPDHFIDRFWGYMGLSGMRRRLRAIIKSLSVGTTEILFHPGLLESHNRMVLYSSPRQIELRCLCDPALKSIFVREGIPLIGCRDL